MKNVIVDWYAMVYENAGLTRGQTSWNQRELIFLPIRNEDKFTQFGSLSLLDAKKRWVEKMKKQNLNYNSIAIDVLVVRNGKINTHPWAKRG